MQLENFLPKLKPKMSFETSYILDKLDKLDRTLLDIAKSLKAIADQYCSTNGSNTLCTNPCCQKPHNPCNNKTSQIQLPENGYSYFE